MRSMTVSDLIAALSRLNPDMPARVHMVTADGAVLVSTETSLDVDTDTAPDGGTYAYVSGYEEPQ